MGVRVRQRKWLVPMCDLGACGIHVVHVACYLLVYARDFVEDRVRSELWPLLRHHLIASPHVFHERMDVGNLIFHLSPQVIHLANVVHSVHRRCAITVAGKQHTSYT